MKAIIIIVSLLALISCDFKEKEKNIAKDTITTNQKMSSLKKITHVDFKQNPAEEYFFTRKYRLTNSKLYYFENEKLIEMNNKEYLFSKALIDSLPNEIMNKKHLGHTTVEVDIPDWTIEIYFNNTDITYLASGDLPDYMKNYSDLAWKTTTGLDRIQ